MQLDADQLQTVAAADLALLVEWLFEQRGFCTQRANLQVNCLDLELFNQPQAYRTFARVYLNGRIPINAIYEVLNTLQGKAVKKIHLYVFGEFSPAQKRAAKQYPMTLVMKEINDLRDDCETRNARSAHGPSRRRERPPRNRLPTGHRG